MVESKRWVVTMSGARPINHVASNIESAGFVIDQILEQIGIITGSATDSVAEAVRAIAGVDKVELDQPPEPIPPDSPT